jgi:hypothetical protein
MAFGMLVAVMLAPACIFDTRDAQDPGEPSDDVVSLDTPEQVFQAIAKTMETQKDANYENATSESFVFSPTITDSLDQNFTGTGVYDNWTKTVEMDVLRLLISDAQYSKVTFEIGEPLINKTTFVRFPVDYTLRVVNVATPGDTADYKGVAQFDVRRENGIWRMTFWNEVETVEGARTWGFLKGILRLRLNP